MILGVYPKKLKTYIYIKASTWMYIAILSIIIARTCEQSRCSSVGEWISKLWSFQTMKNYSMPKRNEFSSHEKKWRIVICILLSESQSKMATDYSILAWRIPWTEGPGGLQSMESLGVGHDWATSLSHFTFMHWRRKWQPTPIFLPGESRGQRGLVGYSP